MRVVWAGGEGVADSCDFEPDQDRSTDRRGQHRDAGVVEGVAVLVYNRTTNIDRKRTLTQRQV